MTFLLSLEKPPWLPLPSKQLENTKESICLYKFPSQQNKGSGIAIKQKLIQILNLNVDNLDKAGVSRNIITLMTMTPQLLPSLWNGCSRTPPFHLTLTQSVFPRQILLMLKYSLWEEILVEVVNVRNMYTLFTQENNVCHSKEKGGCLAARVRQS